MAHRTYGVALVAVVALAVGHAAVSGAEPGTGSGLQDPVRLGQVSGWPQTRPTACV